MMAAAGFIGRNALPLIGRCDHKAAVLPLGVLRGLGVPQRRTGPLSDSYLLAALPKWRGAGQLHYRGKVYALARQSVHARDEGERSRVVGRNDDPRDAGQTRAETLLGAGQSIRESLIGF